MASITIITIVVVALLTVIIFGLAWLGWSSCIKSYKMEVEAGKHDEAIVKEYRSKKNKSGLAGIICSYLALTLLAGLFITGVVYKVRGENLEFNNQTVLVIKSGSMADYYNEDLANEYKMLEYKEYHFDIGDICVFEKTNEDTELVKGEVYGYKYKDIIITHRLIEEPEEGLYRFRGDSNPVSDSLLIGRDNIIYHYLGRKIPGIGAFVLYAQSYFGIWSIIGVIGIAISSEIVYYKLDKINKNRNKLLAEKIKQENQACQNQAKNIRVQFKRRDGTLVTIYKKGTKQVKNSLKEPTAEAPSKTHKENEGAEDEK